MKRKGSLPAVETPIIPEEPARTRQFPLVSPNQKQRGIGFTQTTGSSFKHTSVFENNYIYLAGTC
jgi:hypothetical protein